MSSLFNQIECRSTGYPLPISRRIKLSNDSKYIGETFNNENINF